jgi:poly-gamma-glutamate capsule biosynthesis protein CapA/YwtB (metallophosphatase superfamily)
MTAHPRTLLLAIVLGAPIVAGCAKHEPPPPPSVPAWQDGYRVLFVGDVYFGTSYRSLDERLAEHRADFGFVRLKPFLDAADLVIGNLETPIVDAAASPPFEDSLGYHHWTSADTVPLGLVAQGFDAVGLGNNHALDQGEAGLTQTLDSLAHNRIRAFGAGPTQTAAEQPFETKVTVGDIDLCLAVFAAFEYFEKYDTRHHVYATGDTPGVTRLSAERTSQLVRDYKAAHSQSFVIVFPHWGGNYSWKTASQTPIAKAVLDAGADAVIGHGAHTLQEIDEYGEKIAIYNIGNFVFASPGRYDQYEVLPYSLAVLVRFRADRGIVRADARLYPLATDNRVVAYQPRPLNDEEFAMLRVVLAKKSGAAFSRRVRVGVDALGSFFEVRLK